MDKDEFREFIIRGIEGSVSKKDCIKGVITLLIFSLPSIIFGSDNIILIILALLPTIICIVDIAKTMENGVIKGKFYILYLGVMATSYSLLFTTCGIWTIIFLVEEKYRGLAMVLVVAGYVFSVVLYGCLVRHLIKKKAYSRMKYTNATISTTLFGALGIATAKIFMGRVEAVSPLEVICICSFFIAFLSLLGMGNLYKFWYIQTHEEILDEG